MKKVIALVMCVAMIACIAVTASADAPALTVATVNGKKGDVVAIDINITEKSNIGALEFGLTYDEAQLKVATTKDKKGNDVYYTVGEASTAAGATFMGADGGNPFILTGATVDGYWDKTQVCTVYFEVLADIPVGEVAPINVEVTVAKDCESDETVALTAVNGGVKGVPTKTEPKEPEKKDDDPVTTGTNPKTGDASAVAVAAGLCAVMAAAFVITKKVH